MGWRSSYTCKHKSDHFWQPGAPTNLTELLVIQLSQTSVGRHVDNERNIAAEAAERHGGAIDVDCLYNMGSEALDQTRIHITFMSYRVAEATEAARATVRKVRAVISSKDSTGDSTTTATSQRRFGPEIICANQRRQPQFLIRQSDAAQGST